MVNGQGSIGLELLQQQPDLDAIVAPAPDLGCRTELLHHILAIRHNLPLKVMSVWRCVSLRESVAHEVSIGGGGLISGIATYVYDLGSRTSCGMSRLF